MPILVLFLTTAILFGGAFFPVSILKGQFECLGEKVEKYITFLVTMPVSTLVDNLDEGLYQDQCKNCKSYFEYVIVKGTWLDCNKNYEDLKKPFENAYIYSMMHILKNIAWCWKKGVCPYEGMDSW